MYVCQNCHLVPHSQVQCNSSSGGCTTKLEMVYSVISQWIHSRQPNGIPMANENVSLGYSRLPITPGHYLQSRQPNIPGDCQLFNNSLIWSTQETNGTCVEYFKTSRVWQSVCQNGTAMLAYLAKLFLGFSKITSSSWSSWKCRKLLHAVRPKKNSCGSPNEPSLTDMTEGR
jgi:hypothetical protein